MKTVELLTDLYKKISLNPTAAAALPWDLIHECVLDSLHVKKSIYPDYQYQLLDKDLTTLLIEANNASDTNNIDTLLSRLNSIILILEGMPDSDFVGSFIEEAHFNKALLDHKTRNTVVFLGDSHVNFFSGNEDLTYLPIGNDINVCPNVTGLRTTSLHLGACLAYNVNKVSSSTGFLNKVNYLFESFIEKGSTLVLVLGESDVRAHIKKQADIQGRTCEEIIDDIMVEYSRYILRCKSLGYKVCVWGPIASQPDSFPLNPQFPRCGTELERNHYARVFTEKLRIFCASENISFLSIFDKMLTDGGRTKSEMLAKDQVHLNISVLPLAIEVLKEHGIEL